MKQLYFMLCAVLMLLAGMPVSAQKSYGISGKVTDQAGNGIVGASVVVKGTTTGTSTGSDGSYSLNIKDRNATLVCSFIGMKSAETGINGRTEVNFTLEADAIGLEEVVAIGYGTIRKEEITSSITRVSSDEFLQGSVSNPLQLLQGKVAGLGISKTSGNPSGELSIMLRGISTLAASSAPLIVIDGVAGGSLNAISPEDIESIDVLKDGSAAAIYGTRGTNGVIIINTKRPQSGRVTLEYKGYVTIDQMFDETSDYPNATELRSLKSRLAKEDSRFDLINDFKEYFIKNGQEIYENPSPGNKDGGITTLEDKSLGCTQKSGSSLVKGVLAYAEPVNTKGLNLLSAPGNDLVAATACAASGAQMVLFTTGRGTPFASPVPTVKIATNSRLAGNKGNWIDFNAGRIVTDDLPLEDAAKELFQLVLDVASGKKVKAEIAGFHDLAIFKQGVTL